MAIPGMSEPNVNAPSSLEKLATLVDHAAVFLGRARSSSELEAPAWWGTSVQGLRGDWREPQVQEEAVLTGIADVTNVPWQIRQLLGSSREAVSVASRRLKGWPWAFVEAARQVGQTCMDSAGDLRDRLRSRVEGPLLSELSEGIHALARGISMFARILKGIVVTKLVLLAVLLALIGIAATVYYGLTADSNPVPWTSSAAVFVALTGAAILIGKP